jgi:DNA-binding PucR family transcriptional regulator
VSAQALLPERALAGDADARKELLEHVYRPLGNAGDVLLETVTAFLEAGGSLEATARALFVHPNTVRRIADHAPRRLCHTHRADLGPVGDFHLTK